MTVVVCGRTNRSDRAEQMTRVLREQQGFRTDGGCGRSVDLDNDIQHMRIYRCLGCARWLCQPCIVAHFETTNDAYTPAPVDSPRHLGEDGASQLKGGHVRVTARGESPLTTTTNPSTVNKEHAHASSTPEQRNPDRDVQWDERDRLVGNSADEICATGGAECRDDERATCVQLRRPASTT